MRLIITRHGETKENKQGIIQGHLPGHLSKIGWNQAKKVALRLKYEKIDFIYSSDLDRAVNTTKEIAKFHKETPIKFVEDLRERFLGEWQGKNKKELGSKKLKNIYTLSPQDSEDIYELFKRAQTFLFKIISKHQEDTILLVAHNSINKSLILAITGKSPDDIGNLKNQHNTAVNIYDVDENGSYKIHLFNCIKHLERRFYKSPNNSHINGTKI